MGSDTCRSCHAPIRWSVTGKGKRMPLDAAPVADGNYLLAPGEPPMALAIKDGDAVAPGLLRFTSHFASCPESKTWRKQR